MENLEVKEAVEITEENKEPEKQQPAPKKKRFEKGKVNALLRLREEANVDAKIILNMPKDSVLRVDLAKSTEYFYYVVFEDPEINKDVTGFAMKDFITIMK